MTPGGRLVDVNHTDIAAGRVQPNQGGEGVRAIAWHHGNGRERMGTTGLDQIIHAVGNLPHLFPADPALLPFDRGYLGPRARARALISSSVIIR